MGIVVDFTDKPPFQTVLVRDLVDGVERNYDAFNVQLVPLPEPLVRCGVYADPDADPDADIDAALKRCGVKT